jgi:hypothetical protein
MKFRPDNPKEVTIKELIAVTLAVIAVIVLYGVAARQSIHKTATVNVPIVGEWLAEGKPWRIVFRPDRTVDMSSTDPARSDSAEPSALEASHLGAGAYSLQPGGTLKIQMKNGRTFSAEWKSISPNRFDLIEGDAEGVTTFDRAPAAEAPPAESSAK